TFATVTTKRFYCLPGLSKSSLNRRLRRLAAEQDDPSALSDIVTDCLPVAASADRGITVVDAPGSPSTSVGQPAGEIAGTMPGLRVRYSSVDNFTGSISDDILATYMHCNVAVMNQSYSQIRLLSAYGGRSCGEAVRHILTRVISVAFAPQCNLLGMHGKTAIADNLIYMVVRDAVRVDGRFGNMTDTEYNIVVREWLHNARLRKLLRANKGHVRTS
ncbi:hypothetical protein EG68_12466, partial [Paragonimus skrjabini miyazakii]